MICSSIFFKHKYFTMPTLTHSNALICAANNLTGTIAGIMPSPNITTDTTDQLINIFKLQAEKDKDAATAQRVLKEHARAERVHTETAEPTKSPRAAPTTNPTTITAPILTSTTIPSAEPTARPTTTTATTSMSFPPLKVEYPALDLGTLIGTPTISQDQNDDNSSPAANTCHN
jgi:hypothetical protein